MPNEIDIVSVIITPSAQRADVLTEEVEACTSCNGPLTTGYGMLGGGIGGYGFCPACDRVIWKCQDAG